MLNNVFQLLLAALCVLAAFYGGIIIGIKDCKRHFRIPKEAIGADDDGYLYH